MKLTVLWPLAVICLLVVVSMTTSRIAAQRTTAKLTSDEARELGMETYIYGYPLVTVEMTRRVVTNVTKPEGAHARMGQFANLRKYPNASFRDVTAPNADTLYSSAFLDLAQEPYIYIQKDSPGGGKESNWLPAPAGKFVLMLRMYWPKETPPSILDGSWKPPAVTQATRATN